LTADGCFSSVCQRFDNIDTIKIVLCFVYGSLSIFHDGNVAFPHRTKSDTRMLGGFGFNDKAVFVLTFFKNRYMIPVRLVQTGDLKYE